MLVMMQPQTMTQERPAMMNRLLMILGRHALRLRRNERGVAAVEFALVLPMMLLLYAGSFELGQSVIANRKASNVANIIGDLVAQEAVFTNAGMTTVFDAGKAILTPLPVTSDTGSLLDMTITFISVDAAGRAKLEWTQKPGGGNALTTGTLPTIPAYLLTPNSYLVYSETKYTYTSSTAYVVPTTQTFSSHYFFRTRLNSPITRVVS